MREVRFGKDRWILRPIRDHVDIFTKIEASVKHYMKLDWARTM